MWDAKNNKNLKERKILKLKRKKEKKHYPRCEMHGSTMSPANQYPTQFFSPVIIIMIKMIYDDYCNHDDEARIF